MSADPDYFISHVDVGGAGREFVLACDMPFIARASAIFGQPESGLGVIPGGGGVQHLARLMGRARVLEVMLSADDYDADLAERYGWINRALPANAFGDVIAGDLSITVFVRAPRSPRAPWRSRHPYRRPDTPVPPPPRAGRPLRGRECWTLQRGDVTRGV